MLAFEIYLNGQRVCTAGTDGLSVLTASSGFVLPNEPVGADPVLHLTVGGASVQPPTVITWGQHKLRVGDQVAIKVVETSEVDAPETVQDVPSNAR